VSHVYDLADAIHANSFVDDIRFNGSTAYLTDAGWPGLIVLDVPSGAVRRALSDTPAVTAQKPLFAEGKQLRDPQGRAVVIHADQLEVSPDGTWLYFQPCCGGMSRIATRVLDDASLSAAERAQAVEPFADTPSTGGTAMDADGTIYLSDINALRVLKIEPDGRMTTLLDDSRLVWIDAMWIDEAGSLLMPSAQLNRTPGLNGGVDALQPPLHVYRYAAGLPPLRR
jgi:sugar lactone lactonase YvrE